MLSENQRAEIVVYGFVTELVYRRPAIRHGVPYSYKGYDSIEISSISVIFCVDLVPKEKSRSLGENYQPPVAKPAR